MNSIFLNALGRSRLYPLTDRKISGLSHAEQVERLSQEGLRVIQLREKDLPARDFHEEARAAMAIARPRGVKIIINDRIDIALALGADGVHLGQDDVPPEAARLLLGPDAIIGFSTHDVEQASLAADMPVDYVAIGPIFATSTKQTTDPALGLTGLRLVRDVVLNKPLVAIGGITAANAADVRAAGADALAVIRDIWTPQEDHPEHITSRFPTF